MNHRVPLIIAAVLSTPVAFQLTSVASASPVVVERAANSGDIEKMCTDLTGLTIGVCGRARASFLPCNTKWANACSTAGGIELDCSGTACDQAGAIDCMDDSALLHDCDGDFFDECNESQGDFECHAWEGNDCVEGTCTTPW